MSRPSRRTSPAGTRRSRPRPAGPSAPSPTARLDGWARPIAAELARLAREGGTPRAKLERALAVVFGAFAGSDPEIARAFLQGWQRAREDKQLRLALAWQREQLRLSLAEILAEGVQRGAFRPGLDPGAVAAVALGAAAGCMLQAPTEGGAGGADDLARAVVALVISEA